MQQLKLQSQVQNMGEELQMEPREGEEEGGEGGKRERSSSYVTGRGRCVTSKEGRSASKKHKGKGEKIGKTD